MPLLRPLLVSGFLAISCGRVCDDQQKDLHDMDWLEYLKLNFNFFFFKLTSGPSHHSTSINLPLVINSPAKSSASFIENV